MNSCQALGHEGGNHGAFGETFSGEGFMGEGQTVATAGKLYRMDAGNLPFAEGFDVGLHAELALHDVSQNLRRAAGLVELMDVMSLADVRLIALVAQHRRHLFHGGEKCDDAYREIGRPDEGAALAGRSEEHTSELQSR